MYDSKLWKIMEAYEHMDEYPCTVHETIRVYNIEWDENDLSETPELSDTSSEEMDIEYTQEYEGDHRGRTEEIDKNFMEFYGCVPEYDTELLNAEILESVSSGNDAVSDEGGKTFVLVEPESGLYFTGRDNGSYKFSNSLKDAVRFNDEREAKSVIDRIDSVELLMEIV